MPNDERERKLAERLARFRKKESGESDGEAEAALARDNEELRLRLTEAMKELESAQVVKEDLERRFKILEGGEEDELRKELESLRADISKQMNELSEMRKSGDEKARLERKNEELEEKLQTQREVIEAAQQGINELEATNRQYEEELQALRQERDSLAVEAEVARELKGEIERASELEEKLQTQREVIEAAKQGLNELEAERNSAVAECKQIKEQFALKEALLKQLFNEDEERRKIKKRNEQLESEVRRLTTGRKGPKADEDNFVIGKEDRVKGYITENGFVFPAHKIPIERIVYDREKELVIVVEGGNDSYFILRRNITEILACHDSKFKGEEYNRFNFTNKLTDHVIAIEREVRPGSDAFVEDLKQKIQKAFKPGFEQDKELYREDVSLIAEEISDSIVHGIYTEDYFKKRHKVCFGKAKEHFKNGKYSLALRRLRDVSSLIGVSDPKEINYWTGKTLSKLGNSKPVEERIKMYKEAISLLERVLDERQNATDYHWLGATQSKLGDEVKGEERVELYKKAIANLEIAIEKRSSYYDNYWFGRTLSRLGDEKEGEERIKLYERAKPFLEKAAEERKYERDIKLAETNHLKYAVELKKAKRYDEALEEFNQIILRNPKNKDAYLNIAAIYRDIGEKDPAIENFGKVLKLEPDNAFAKKSIERLKAE